MAKSDITLLKKLIADIKTLDRKMLISRPAWGEIDFETLRETLDRGFGVIDQLALLPIEILSTSTTKAITEAATVLKSALDGLNTFSIKSSAQGENLGIDKKMQAVSQKIVNAEDALFSASAPWIPYLAVQSGDIQRNITNLNQAVKDAENSAIAAKEGLNRSNAEMQQIISAAREASAAAGAAVFTHEFSTTSGKYDKAATTWLKVTTFCAGMTLITAALMWWFTENNLDQGAILQKLSTKLVMLGLLLTATLWCGRNYKASKHLAAIYQHKAVSITTMQAFIAACSAVTTKDTVTLEAARAVYGNPQTGYVDGAVNDGDVKIVEIVKSILPSKE